MILNNIQAGFRLTETLVQCEVFDVSGTRAAKYMKKNRYKKAA